MPAKHTKMVVNDILALIRAERMERNLTQKHMASVLKCSQQNYAKMENGGMTIEQMLKCMEILGLDLLVVPKRYLGYKDYSKHIVGIK